MTGPLVSAWIPEPTDCRINNSYVHLNKTEDLEPDVHIPPKIDSHGCVSHGYGAHVASFGWSQFIVLHQCK